MVFRKLLASLGLGGVEADTVLPPTPVAPGGTLTGQVNLRVKSDTEITSITLILVAQGPFGELELSSHQVSGQLQLTGGTSRSKPFTITVPAGTPFTTLYGQTLPGFTLGVRTQLTVASGSAKGDFDPVAIEAGPAQQGVIDALGAVGAKFAGNAIRPATPPAQELTFFAPVPEGTQLGPHIPRVTFLLAGAAGGGLTVFAELTGRPDTAERHDLSPADIERLGTSVEAWVEEIDPWLISVLSKVGSAPAAGRGSFLTPGAPAAAGAGRGPQGPYAYGGQQQQQGYSYGGRSSMGGTLLAGVAGGALGFLGGMMIGGMISDMMTPDAADPSAMEDPGAMAEDPGADYGGDYGGDFGGDFGGDAFGGGEF